MDISKALALSATLLGVAILSGCHREIDTPDSNSDLHEVVFHADWDEETKTALREDGSVCWVPGDQISLFTGPGKDGGYVLTAATSEPSPTADFFGSIGEGELYSAIYPYDDCDYGRGYSSAVVARGNHNYSEEFSITLAHEFGHSFAKLADEYVTYDSEAGESPIFDITMTFSRFGWYKNVDVTSDPTTIRWSRFLSDERYANEKLGAYEGGFNYSKGVWRPNENSIMRNGTEFNAPSRAAIYNRIHKLAYGKDWQFDYETFVQQDLKNIPSSQIVQSSSKYIPSPARVPRKHLFKMEESVTGDGRKMITVIQD